MNTLNDCLGCEPRAILTVGR